MNLDIEKIKAALKRGLDKEHQKKFNDAMECMTTHRWYWRWAHDLESNCKEALAALDAYNPIAIEAERDRYKADADRLAEALADFVALYDDDICMDSFPMATQVEIKATTLGHLRQTRAALKAHKDLGGSV